MVKVVWTNGNAFRKYQGQDKNGYGKEGWFKAEVILKQTDKDVVVVSKERYEELIESEHWLSCLESAGVDNWSGIDYAYELHESEEE